MNIRRLQHRTQHTFNTIQRKLKLHLKLVVRPPYFLAHRLKSNALSKGKLRVAIIDLNDTKTTIEKKKQYIFQYFLADLIVQKFDGVKTRSFLQKLGMSSYQRKAHLEF